MYLSSFAHLCLLIKSSLKRKQLLSLRLSIIISFNRDRSASSGSITRLGQKIKSTKSGEHEVQPRDAKDNTGPSLIGSIQAGPIIQFTFTCARG